MSEGPPPVFSVPAGSAGRLQAEGTLRALPWPPGPSNPSPGPGGHSQKGGRSCDACGLRVRGGRRAQRPPLCAGGLPMDPSVPLVAHRVEDFQFQIGKDGEQLIAKLRELFRPSIFSPPSAVPEAGGLISIQKFKNGLPGLLLPGAPKPLRRQLLCPGRAIPFLPQKSREMSAGIAPKG
jgi:hypothetical protein